VVADHGRTVVGSEEAGVDLSQMDGVVSVAADPSRTEGVVSEADPSQKGAEALVVTGATKGQALVEDLPIDSVVSIGADSPVEEASVVEEAPILIQENHLDSEVVDIPVKVSKVAGKTRAKRCSNSRTTPPHQNCHQWRKLEVGRGGSRPHPPRDSLPPQGEKIYIIGVKITYILAIYFLIFTTFTTSTTRR